MGPSRWGHPEIVERRQESEGRSQNSVFCLLTSVSFRILTGHATYHFVPTVNFMVKPNEQLVTVSFTGYPASTSVLSNWSSSSALIRYLNLGRSHLREGFTLICIQRLSRPDFATQLCHWRDNWITRGLFIPVLSY